MVRIAPLDDVWIRIDCDDAVARELSDYFTFETPNSRFMQRQAKYRRWDGRIRLFKLKTRTLYRGLSARVVEFCEQRGYDVENDVPEVAPVLPGGALDTWLSTLTLPFQPHEDQKRAVRTALDSHRCVILSPTTSGKSFIIYLLTQAIARKTLIVVPTIGLVSQLAKDFKKYGFDVNDLHSIQAGTEKDANAKVYVSTWQSIYKLPPEYYAQFGCIIVDELHHAKSKSISHLLEQAHSTAFRIGLTGTLDETQAHQLILEGLFGPVHRVATTAQLQQKGRLSPLRVNMVFLKYPEQARKLLRKAQWQDEIDYIVQDGARLEFCARLASELKGNVLLLFNYVGKHGIPLFERIQAKTNKPCHYIAGSVDGDEREEIRETVQLDKDEDHIINASYGTFSTGINIPSIRHIIFAGPAKSKIRVMQSIGRGLRLDDGKGHCTLWDLVDDLRIGKHVNYTMQHAESRALYYAAEKFPVSMKQISLSAFAVKTPSPDGVATAPLNAGETA